VGRDRSSSWEEEGRTAAFRGPLALLAGHPGVIDGAVGSSFWPTRDHLTLVGVGHPDAYDQANDPEFLPVARQKVTRGLQVRDDPPQKPAPPGRTVRGRRRLLVMRTRGPAA